MKHYTCKYLDILLLSVLFTSCVKDNSFPLDQNKYLKIDEAVSSGSLFIVKFFSKDSLFVGYNKVYFTITDKSLGNQVSEAAISLHPLMNMMTSSHACPVENPDPGPNADGYFEGAVIFSMPGLNNEWSLSVNIAVNGSEGSVYFPISKVISSNPVKKIVIIDSLSNGAGSWTITKYPVSLVEPANWKVGTNPFEITVHTMASMMNFPCCDDFTVEITPEMPSMGHGSPNNVNPVSTGRGHYLGTVNFTMTGAWRINMVFKKGNRIIGHNAYFDINV